MPVALAAPDGVRRPACASTDAETDSYAPAFPSACANSDECAISRLDKHTHCSPGHSRKTVDSSPQADSKAGFYFYAFSVYDRHACLVRNASRPTNIEPCFYAGMDRDASNSFDRHFYTARPPACAYAYAIQAGTESHSDQYSQ